MPTFTAAVGTSLVNKFETYLLDAPSLIAAVRIATREGQDEWGTDVRVLEIAEVGSTIISTHNRKAKSTRVRRKERRHP